MSDDFEEWWLKNVDLDMQRCWVACLSAMNEPGPCGKGHPISAWEKCTRCQGTGTVDGPFDKTPFTCTDCVGTGGHCLICDAEQKGREVGRNEARLELRVSIGEVWHWQGDEYDYPESLTCPIIIQPKQMLELLDRLRTRKEG